MKTVRFLMPCKAEYRAKITVPDEIADDTEQLADYINSHKMDVEFSEICRLEWNEDEDITAADLDYFRVVNSKEDDTNE